MAPAPPASDIVQALLVETIGTDDIRTTAPPKPGLYAWWGPATILPELVGLTHPTTPGLRLLYVGLATKLRSRLASNHLRRSGSSTLRRTLAGLLIDEQGYRTRRTDRVVLLDEEEARLTYWMRANLRVSWCEHPAPREVEADLIRRLRPPLNVDHVPGASVAFVKAARRRYIESAEQPRERRSSTGSEERGGH